MGRRRRLPRSSRPRPKRRRQPRLRRKSQPRLLQNNQPRQRQKRLRLRQPLRRQRQRPRPLRLQRQRRLQPQRRHQRQWLQRPRRQRQRLQRQRLQHRSKHHLRPIRRRTSIRAVLGPPCHHCDGHGRIAAASEAASAGAASDPGLGRSSLGGARKCPVQGNNPSSLGSLCSRIGVDYGREALAPRAIAPRVASP